MRRTKALEIELCWEEPEDPAALAEELAQLWALQLKSRLEKDAPSREEALARLDGLMGRLREKSGQKKTL